MSETYDAVNKAWKDACRIVIKGEIGELETYKDWLYGSTNGPRIARKSDVSGKEAVYADAGYPAKAKWMSLDDVDFDKKYGQLDINKLKDLDSIIDAISERIYYTGNIVLGNSKFVEKSANVMDSFYVYHSERQGMSKYSAYSTFCTAGECVFGCNGLGFVSYSIKSHGVLNSKRDLLVSRADNCSDCYYSHGLSGCSDCMFCFNVKNMRHAIGNLELEPSKYAGIKTKLLSEMREKLVRDKRLPSLVELALLAKPDFATLKKTAAGMPSSSSGRQDIAFIEEAFSKTTRVIFGRELNGIETYGGWLKKHTVNTDDGESCTSGMPITIAAYANFMTFPKDRLLTNEEAEFIGSKARIGKSDAEIAQFGSIGKILSKVGFFSPEWRVGISDRTVHCPINLNSSYCFRTVLAIESKECAYSYLPRNSDFMFGANEVRYSSFCINCYHSGRLKRCFELDSSIDCSDCYFCHNAENCQECMFCFNVKNKKFAIGNVEYPREEYLKFKHKILAQIVTELEKAHSLKYDIYNLGSFAKK